MKTRFITGLLAAGAFLFLPASIHAQDIDLADSTGLPGDHFSLEGALDLFKKAESPEAFEKLLNTENNYVNNLDLNEDGEIDYIRVIDNMDGNSHAIVLQVPVSETESQDIAVIEVEKKGDEEAILQIIGDEAIYGEQIIVEPTEADQIKPNKGRGGPAIDFRPDVIVVNVWLWPGVRYIYGPRYTLWVSPWRWRYYPAWWRPWRPHPWRYRYARVAPYRRHCTVVTTHRVVHAHGVYAPRRTSSTVVHSRTTTAVAARGKHGTTVVGKKTTTSTTVKGRNGRSVTKEKTTTKAARQGRNGNVSGKKTTTKTTTRRKGRQ